MADFEENVEEMVGRLEKRQMATESGRNETGDETGGPEDETGDKTMATAGDERDGGDRWCNVCRPRSVYNRRPPSLFGELWKLYNNYVFCVVYCLLCCVLFVVYHSTVLRQQSNANFFNKI